MHWVMLVYGNLLVYDNNHKWLLLVESNLTN